MADLTKTDVKKIVKDEIDRFVSNEMDKEVKGFIKKSNSQTRNELTDLIANSLESVFKTIWQKRQFWKTDIK